VPEILVAAELKPDRHLIDVGCGAGRLAHTLDVARYVGTDIVPEPIAYSPEICGRPNWRFEVADPIAISLRVAKALSHQALLPR